MRRLMLLFGCLTLLAGEAAAQAWPQEAGQGKRWADEGGENGRSPLPRLVGEPSLQRAAA